MLREHPALRPRDVWVLLWSQRQGCLHIETLDRTFKSNWAAFAEDRSMDYVPLIIGDRELIDAQADELHALIDDRAAAREKVRDLLEKAKGSAV